MKYKLKDSYVSRVCGGEHITMGMGAGAFSGLIRANESAAMLMDLLGKGAEESELTAALTARYDVDEASAAADVAELLGTLRGIDAIEESE